MKADNDVVRSLRRARVEAGARRWWHEVWATWGYAFTAGSQALRKPDPRPPAQNEWIMTCPVYRCEWAEYVAGTWAAAETARETHVLTHQAGS